MASPLMPFLGGLRNQAVEIVSALHYYADKTGLFCDPFFGGGSISLEAKRRNFKVYANDLAKRSFYPARALIVNNEPLRAEGVARLLKPHPDEDDFISEKVENVIETDILRFSRRLWHNAQNDTEKYLAIRVFLDLVPMGGFGLIKKTDTSMTATKAKERAAQLLKTPLPLIDRSRQSINSGIFANNCINKAFQRDAVEHIKACAEMGAIIVHLDPPTYGTKQYDNHYWWLDWYVGDVVTEQGRGFSKREAVDFSAACVAAAANVPVVAITQQEVAYPKNQAFELLETAGRRTEGFEVKSNTNNPFYFIVGLLK